MVPRSCIPAPGLLIALAGVVAATPPPAAGTWSAAHLGTWCEKGALVRDLGKAVPLPACKAACVANATCGYICHADQSDGRCMLYSSCPTPRCGRRTGWFTTYQLGRGGAEPWAAPCPAAPPPPPPAPGAMDVVVVSPAITAKHGAKCLDGTPPAFKIRRGVGANASRFIVFLEGGGWCFGVEDCTRRRGGGLGSSKAYTPGSTTDDLGGVMAFNSTTNRDFHTWTMVFVHYCDGSSFSSYRPDPISTEAGPLWFRGRANLAATLEQLSDPTHGLGSASELILSGGSAGGLAVYYHLDYVAAFVRHAAPSCRVTGFPDAGYFADLQDTTGKLAYRGFFQTADSTAWNTTVSGGSNAACLAANAGASSWKCLMAEYLTDYIETPMYVMNAAFDVYQLQHILDVGCVPSQCSAAQIRAIEGYRAAYLNHSVAHLVARARSHGHGCFIDSCLVHEQNLDYCSGGNPHAYNCAGWLTTKIGGVTAQQAYAAWYRGGGGGHNLTIDPTATVENPSCPWSFKLS